MGTVGRLIASLFLSCVVFEGCLSAPAKKKAAKFGTAELNPSWPAPAIRSAFGQIGGVSIDHQGNTFVFHREKRTWDADDFNEKFSYVKAKSGPIEGNPIVVLSPTGEVLLAFGSDRFYLPHGITVDSHGNVWVTDVALHQVLKFEPGKRDPILSVGENLIPGSDDSHLCQPTSVAVASTGEFFVADGYCNSRILKFSANGTLIKKWGRKKKGAEPLSPDTLSVPHGVTLSEERDLLCAADREHMRVLCWKAGLREPEKAGEFAFNITWPDMGRPFDVKFNDHYGVLVVLANNEFSSRGIVFSLKSRHPISFFDNPSVRGFGAGHTLAVCPGGHTIAVGSLSFQCPDLLIPDCQLMRSPLDQNLWRFHVMGAQEPPRNVDFSEAQLQAAMLQEEERKAKRQQEREWLEQLSQ